MTDEPQPTLAELQERARELNITGRSTMNSEELATAIAGAETALAAQQAEEAAKAAEEEAERQAAIAALADNDRPMTEDERRAATAAVQTAQERAKVRSNRVRRIGTTTTPQED